MNQRPVILHLLNSLSDSSITRIVERIIRQQGPAAADWRVAALGGSNGLMPLISSLGAQTLDFSARPGWEILQAYLAQNRVDILHSHTPHTIVTAWRAITGLERNQRPIHLATKHLLTRPADRRGGLVYALADRLALYLPDHLVAVSRTMAREIARWPGLGPSRVSAIPNGIPVELYGEAGDRDTLREATRQELNFPAGALVFGFAGRLDQVKRLDILLAAFAAARDQLPQARLLILGQGPLLATWQDQAARLGIEAAVCWAGFRHDMPRMLAAMDLYVQCSVNEGLSLSILEAMAARLCVIATRVGAAEEVLTHAVTGWLIPPGSAAELAAALVHLGTDTLLRRRLAAAAAAEVGAHYSVTAMTAAYGRVYRQLLDRRPPHA
ncbi:MAG TPA: glycosyltransferase [Anaerolineaceae bacterium]|jgi:glycosyltransferase involved in cell wall biosynthesis|nr:glycosyltransferase [Anaerolineaceae bacterium]